MKRHSDDEVIKLRNLRKETGYSFLKLEEMTGVPSSTIRNWCYNVINITQKDTLRKRYARIRNEILESEKDVLNDFSSISPNQAKFFASLLYWCEGSKYPSSNKLEFCNSDPYLLKTFISFLRRGFPLDESKFHIHLQIHTTHNYNQIRKFWSDLLNIPQDQFMKPTITEKRGGKHREEYLGTCSLRYSDFRVQLKLIGISHALGKSL